MLFETPQQLDFFVCPLDKLIGINHNSSSSQQQFNNTTVLLLNPPYGLRLGKKSSQTLLYQRIAMRVSEIYQYIHLKKSEKDLSNDKVTGVDSECGRTTSPILMMGYCICSNEVTTKEFIKGITKNKFFTETHIFSHGGKERYVVSFRSL
jgi:predicted RNA methylase